MVSEFTSPTPHFDNTLHHGTDYINQHELQATDIFAQAVQMLISVTWASGKWSTYLR